MAWFKSWKEVIGEKKKGTGRGRNRDVKVTSREHVCLTPLHLISITYALEVVWGTVQVNPEVTTIFIRNLYTHSPINYIWHSARPSIVSKLCVRLWSSDTWVKLKVRGSAFKKLYLCRDEDIPAWINPQKPFKYLLKKTMPALGSIFPFLFCRLKIQKCWTALGSLCSGNNYPWSLWKQVAPLFRLLAATFVQTNLTSLMACVWASQKHWKWATVLLVELRCYDHSWALYTSANLECCIGRRGLTAVCTVWPQQFDARQEETSSPDFLLYANVASDAGLSRIGKLKCSELLLFKFCGMSEIICYRFVTSCCPHLELAIFTVQPERVLDQCLRCSTDCALSDRLDFCSFFHWTPCLWLTATWCKCM